MIVEKYEINSIEDFMALIEKNFTDERVEYIKEVHLRTDIDLTQAYDYGWQKKIYIYDNKRAEVFNFPSINYFFGYNHTIYLEQEIVRNYSSSNSFYLLSLYNITFNASNIQDLILKVNLKAVGMIQISILSNLPQKKGVSMYDNTSYICKNVIVEGLIRNNSFLYNDVMIFGTMGSDPYFPWSSDASSGDRVLKCENCSFIGTIESYNIGIFSNLVSAVDCRVYSCGQDYLQAKRFRIFYNSTLRSCGFIGHLVPLKTSLYDRFNAESDKAWFEMNYNFNCFFYFLGTYDFENDWEDRFNLSQYPGYIMADDPNFPHTTSSNGILTGSFSISYVSSLENIEEEEERPSNVDNTLKLQSPVPIACTSVSFNSENPNPKGYIGTVSFQINGNSGNSYRVSWTREYSTQEDPDFNEGAVQNESGQSAIGYPAYAVNVWGETLYAQHVRKKTASPIKLYFITEQQPIYLYTNGIVWNAADFNATFELDTEVLPNKSPSDRDHVHPWGTVLWELHQDGYYIGIPPRQAEYPERDKEITVLQNNEDLYLHSVGIITQRNLMIQREYTASYLLPFVFRVEEDRYQEIDCRKCILEEGDETL